MKSRRTHKKRKNYKAHFIGWGLIFSILLAGVVYAVHVYQMGKEPQDPSSDELISVTIPEGASQAQIAKELSDRGLIHSELHFRVFNQLQGDGGHFQAGDYVFSPSMNLREITNSLKRGSSGLESQLMHKITFPEGSTIEEMAEIIDQNSAMEKGDFLSAVQDENFIQDLYDLYPGLLEQTMADDQIRYKLEGYLFPATYEIGPETTAKDLIREMVVTTASLYEKHEDEINSSELSFHEMLTLASFIEKEGISEEDRKLISGVFYNRLEADMPLQTDVSVAYILSEHKEILSLEDVRIESPYNLYIHSGMGPGPVNNPSEVSWEAALHPTNSDYLYFLADIHTKEVYYAKTYEEHLALKEKYVDNLTSENDGNEEDE